MRLIAGKVMMDRHVPDYLCETRRGELRADPGVDPPLASARRLGYAITPRFAPTSTPALLEAVQRLRAEFPDTWLQTPSQ
ncbi:Guanine deaminase [Klebsiella pneumoniae]|uniref:Guanine deaminase n=1 Tax=Klebsiella pneumoniae TaxID=573 RepID=A0A2X3DTD1_KLEPN|nr:Guanine deaminase [Klebsiella pneumoniae]